MKNKKVILVFLMLFVLVIIGFFMWRNSRSISFKDDKVMAIINIGSDEKSYDYSLVKKYYGNKKIPEISTSGSEKYLIIPRYKDSYINVYELVINDSGSFDKIRRGMFSEPFYITCNISDIFSNVLIEMIYDGKVYNYSPYISLKDGSLFVEDFVLEVKKMEV